MSLVRQSLSSSVSNASNVIRRVFAQSVQHVDEDALSRVVPIAPFSSSRDRQLFDFSDFSPDEMFSMGQDLFREELNQRL